MYQVDHFINGEKVATKTSQHHVIYNPAKGEPVGQVPFADDALVDQAVAAAQKAFPSWAATPPLKRARVLFKFKELLEKHTDALAAMVTREHGKVLADACGSVARGIELTEFMCGIPHLLKGSYSDTVAADMDCYTIRQPLGVCMGVTPFNFPVMVPVWMFVSAIACGNTFVLKPSEKDPSAPLYLAELMHEAGLPAGVLNVVNGDKGVVDRLLAHLDVVAASCVGSTPVAKYIYETAINNGKRAHAFGGAKNHCIVMPDADLDDAANAIAGAAFGAAGERCMALSIAVVVGEGTADTLVEKIQGHAEQLTIAPGTDKASDMGPLVTKEHHNKVKSYVDLGVKEGAVLLVDGRDYQVKGHEQGYFMGACLFDHVAADMRIYQEEIFGPVLCVVRVTDFSTALALINNHEYGNGTAIFTRDGDVARQFAHQVQVGMVGINVPIPVPVAYHSFGGWKNSVFGDVRLHGEEGVAFYTKAKSITVRWPKGITTGYVMPSH